MTKDEYKRLLAEWPPVFGTIMGELHRHGKASVPMLLEPCGRTNGMTPEMRRLMKRGLVREAGRDLSATTNGMKPRLYEPVPLDQVEAAQAAYVDPPVRSSGGAASARRRLSAVPKRQPGDRLDGLVLRRTALRALAALESLEDAGLAFWDEMTVEEMKMLVGELGDVQEAIVRMLGYMALRVDDDVTLAKIEKMLVTNGRTEHEQATAKVLIAKLERRRGVG
jgi:hypothetical protein